jgi:hypothetical protein
MPHHPQSGDLINISQTGRALQVFFSKIISDALPVHPIPCITRNFFGGSQSGVHPKNDFVTILYRGLDVRIDLLVVEIEQHLVKLFSQHVIKFPAFAFAE